MRRLNEILTDQDLIRKRKEHNEIKSILSTFYKMDGYSMAKYLLLKYKGNVKNTLIYIKGIINASDEDRFTISEQKHMKLAIKNLETWRNEKEQYGIYEIPKLPEIK